MTYTPRRTNGQRLHHANNCTCCNTKYDRTMQCNRVWVNFDRIRMYCTRLKSHQGACQSGPFVCDNAEKRGEVSNHRVRGYWDHKKGRAKTKV